MARKVNASTIVKKKAWS